MDCKSFINVKNVKIGIGRPKICVPLTGHTLQDLENQAKAAKDSEADIIELRIDYFIRENGKEKVLDVIGKIRKITQNIPLIFTFRTKEEGGECKISLEDYEQLNCAVAEHNMADIIDVEYNLGEELVQRLCKTLKLKRINVIVSKHNFSMTESEQELAESMNKMAFLGADIVKVAMMPMDKFDVIRLMKVTLIMQEKLSVPIIAMSMGKLGAISRLCGEFFGSSVTFATVGDASAPGQMKSEKVLESLELIHRQFEV